MKRYISVILLSFIIVTQALAEPALNRGLELLRLRKDAQALVIFEQVLKGEPNNPDALWGKAEVLRRRRQYRESETVLNQILAKNPKDPSALNSLAYIRYQENKLDESLNLVNQILKIDNLDKENAALAYLMLGGINGERTDKGWFLNKIVYGTQIKRCFLKAKELAPDLPEVHLGMGTFYLVAPAIAGGNPDQALEELNIAFGMAPDFANVNARLAQAYQKKGDLKKYNFYLQRTKELDPGNEILKELVSY